MSILYCFWNGYFFSLPITYVLIYEITFGQHALFGSSLYFYAPARFRKKMTKRWLKQETLAALLFQTKPGGVKELTKQADRHCEAQCGYPFNSRI